MQVVGVQVTSHPPLPACRASVLCGQLYLAGHAGVGWADAYPMPGDRPHDMLVGLHYVEQAVPVEEESAERDLLGSHDSHCFSAI
jgi:hypothetical protein